MSKIKNQIKNNFNYFFYFYSFLKWRILLSLILSMLVGIMDGFGLAMFLPLMQSVGGSEKAESHPQMGNLSFLTRFFYYLDIPLTLYVVLFTILIFFSIKGVFKFFEGYVKLNNEQFFINTIRIKNIKGLSSLSFRKFTNSDVGRIQNTLSGEVEKTNSAYRFYFFAAQYLVFVLVYLVMAFFANPQFAVLVALGGGLTSLVFRRIYKRAKSLSKRITTSAHVFQGQLIQKVAFFKYLKATGLIHKYSSNLIKTSNNIQESQKKVGMINAITQAVREPFIILVVVAVIIIQVRFFSQSMGLIILSLLLFYRALIFLMGMQNYWTNFLGVSGSLENMSNFYQELKEGTEPDGNLEFHKFKDYIEIRDLSFNYDKTPVLNHICASIKKNETIAIVGESGSGKTTLMNILTGILHADLGSVTIDGKDIRKFKMKSYQNRIGYITQEPVIFNDTIFNNITFWDEPTSANLERFYSASRKAAIFDFISEQHEKENTFLGNNGINISGGQKQRISIARELYKDVDFLFLDEATSALDAETERMIQENISELKGKYTIIIIAHRLSTIKDADRIILLRKGEIENTGSFYELLQSSQSFKRMVELQEFYKTPAS